MNNELDVLIIGGYGVAEIHGANAESRNRTRLHLGGHPATVGLLRSLVRHQGDLEEVDADLRRFNPGKVLTSPLGAIYLVDFLRKRGVRAEAVGYFAYEQDRFQELMAGRPPIVAISTTYITEPDDIGRIARAVKEAAPGTLVVAGGAKVLKSYRELCLYRTGYFDDFDIEPMARTNVLFPEARQSDVDLYVIEDCGEETLLTLSGKVARGESVRGTPNLAWWDASGLVITDRQKEPYSFERNVVDWARVPASQLCAEIPVRGGVGCPFQCAFCDCTRLHSEVRGRSLDSLVAELREADRAHPGKPVIFTDENLFSTRRRVRDLCSAIIENDLHFAWRAFMRADAIAEDNVELLAKAGCQAALLGVESGDPGILGNMKKGTTPERTLQAIRLLDGQDIHTVSTVIIGFPGETGASVARTVELLNAYPNTGEATHQYIPFSYVNFPLAPVNAPESRERFGLRGLYEDWSHDTMSANEAADQLERLCREVTAVTLQYPEALPGDLPAGRIAAVFRARDELVRRGLRSIDPTNAAVVYETFRTLMN